MIWWFLDQNDSTPLWKANRAEVDSDCALLNTTIGSLPFCDLIDLKSFNCCSSCFIENSCKMLVNALHISVKDRFGFRLWHVGYAICIWSLCGIRNLLHHSLIAVIKEHVSYKLLLRVVNPEYCFVHCALGFPAIVLKSSTQLMMFVLASAPRSGSNTANHFPEVKVVTDGPIEEILKLFKKEGRLAKWVGEIRTYDISFIPRKEAEGLIMEKFFGQGEHVEGTPDANEGGTFTLSKKLQAKSTPTPRAWRLYVGRETIEEGLGVGIILVSPEEKMHSYAIRLKFHASNHVMDYEALLAGLAASTNQGMKDLHVFIDSLTLVVEVEGIHTPVTEQERKYKEEILDATVPFYRFRITHLLKILNSKAEVLTGLTTIKLEFLN
ncbi:reverse transcriptase domain-containing protein [Tanacetum coccineum]